MAPERRLFGLASPIKQSYTDRDYLQHQPNDSFTTDESRLSDVRSSRRAEEAASRRYQAAKWLQDMLGSLGLSEDPTDEELRLCLKNGLVLCNLLDKIQPGAVPKVVENPPSLDGARLSYQHFENVRNFVIAVEEMRLPTFDASDLSQGNSSMSNVVDCILALKTYYEWREGKATSPWKQAASKKSGEESYRVEGTPKSNHSRKRWAIPDLPEGTDISYEFDSPQGRKESSAFEAMLDSENFASYLASPAARLHQIGQKFREVLQVKRMQEHSSELAGNDGNVLDTPANFKEAHVQSLVKSLISGKPSEEVPVLVEFMMRKVMEEFERRVRSQQDQSRKLKNTLKDLIVRESKLASRAKVLEALAAGSGEEIKLVTLQLHQIKVERKRLEDEKRKIEEEAKEFLKENLEKTTTINMLNDRITSLEKEHQESLDRQQQDEKLITEYEYKLKEIQSNLAESLENVASVTAAAASEREAFKQREGIHKTIIIRQAEALQETKLTASSVKEAASAMQHCWQEQLLNLEGELSELASAAQSYHNVLAENRRLYNEVQELKGNIRVYCRVRPFLDGKGERHSSVEFVGENGEIMISNPTKHGKDSSRMFNFNKVYGPGASQEQVFLDTEPLIRSVLDGFNVCIFAYGQTGSGKTYTMSGPSATTRDDWGVNNRALYDLFQICQKRKDFFFYEVGVQMIEIYNEQVRDLLAADGVSKRLGIRNRSALNGLNVPDALMIPVTTTDDVLEIMAIGQRNRAVGATALNERSSRSHSVLTVHVQGTELANGSVLRGCLHLVDLAGSERVEKSEATGERLKEAQHINKSLSALGDVIAALAQKSSHIPYRNSKLTQLLQDALGGHAKTLMFVHINPDVESYGETISTLKFAERVSAVELGAARTNREGGEYREFKEQIAGLKEQLAKKDAEIEKLKLQRQETDKARLLKGPLSNRSSIESRIRRPGEFQPRATSRAGSVEAWLEEASGTSSRPTSAHLNSAASSTVQHLVQDSDAENGGNLSPPPSHTAEPRGYISDSDPEQHFDIVHEFPQREQTGMVVDSEGYASEGETSQDLISAPHSTTRSTRSFNALRSSTHQPQIPRPPRSEKKHPLSLSLTTGLRRMSDAGQMLDYTRRASSDVAKRSAAATAATGKRWL